MKHLFVAAEMGAKEIHERCLARALNCSPDDFSNESGHCPEFQRKIADLAATAKDGVIYQDAPGLTFDDLRRYVSSAVHTHKIEGVIIDYWQLVGGRGKNRSEAAHLDEVAQRIADFGRKNGVWSITMAQINQEGNTRGGEGIRLAFDQVYHLKGMGQDEDISLPQRWLQMLDTRYTAWKNVGDNASPGFLVNGNGPYFEQP